MAGKLLSSRAGRAGVNDGLCSRLEVVPVALETGRWRGEREGQAEGSGAECPAAGTCAAKWRRIDGAWLLEAEIFAAEACGGDLCPVDDGYVPWKHDFAKDR